jgi:hypothetical protein
MQRGDAGRHFSQGEFSMCNSIGIFVRAAAGAWLAVTLAASVHAAGNVVMALDGMIVNNSGGGQPLWGGFGRFSYAATGTTVTIGTPTTPGLGRYDAFTIAEPGLGGSGVGVNFANGNVDPTTGWINSPVDAFLGIVRPVTANMFPLLDRGTFGINFDPTQYVAELIYKPLAGNTATQLNMTVDTTDGFSGAGLRSGEQWQWGFFDLVNTYNNTQTNGDLDADGFARSFSNMGVMSQAAANFTGQSFMYADNVNNTDPPSNPTGDGSPDFNDFEGTPLAVPNGAVQIHLQTVFGAGEALIDNWEIKALRIIKINPDRAEVARMDARGGFSQRFGSPFERNAGTINIDGVDYDPLVTDQVSRFNASGFTNIVVNTDDDNDFGGLGLWQPASTQTFDGTTAAIEIRARLTAPLGEGQADHITLVTKDKDGNGTLDAGDFGGEDYHFNVPLSSFNEASMVTLSLPFTAATMVQAQEFATPGDGLLTDFNLYYLGLQTDAGAGLVDVEIESISIVVPPPRAGDFDYDGDVDGNDFLVWQRTVGQSVATAGTRADANGNNVVDEGDLDIWRTNFATATGAAASVPEPAGGVLVAVAIMAAAIGRRGKSRNQ